MEKEDKYPNLIIRTGTGSFTSNDIEFEASFELIYYPEKTIIKTQVDNEHTQLKVFFENKREVNWELKGIIENGINIIARELHLERMKNGNFYFQPLKEIVIGDNKEDYFNYAEFPLIGFYAGNINFKYNNWQIESIVQNENPQIQKLKSKYWSIQLEGLTLTLSSKAETKEEFHSKANNISSLLSLAVGNDIIFDRQLFYKNDKLTTEIWRRKAGYNFGVLPSLPEDELNYFIKNSLDKFEIWDEEKKITFNSAVNYINSSSQGYLENRLLRLCIAWESIASRWAKENDIINEELEPLKNHLKKTIDDFELPKSHDKSFIKDRILGALEWGKLYNKLMGILKQYKLNHNKLGLDFKTLIKIRNDIAHSGRFRKKYSKEDLVALIFNNKLGLQVLLLRELGYDSYILTHKNKWKTRIKIEELLS